VDRAAARQDVIGLVHHRDWGGQYRAIRYTERLGDAEAVASVGGKGDSYDNAMAEALNSLFKVECIRNPATRSKGGWKNVSDVETAVAEYVDWFNHRRLHGEIGLIPPPEFEANHWAKITPEHTPNHPSRQGLVPTNPAPHETRGDLRSLPDHRNRWKNCYHPCRRGRARWPRGRPLDRVAERTISLARFLSAEERLQNADRLRAGESVRATAAVLGRSPSTISREIRRHGRGDGVYRPFEAQRVSAQKRWELLTRILDTLDPASCWGSEMIHRMARATPTNSVGGPLACANIPRMPR
jgi:hypothetical protein